MRCPCCQQPIEITHRDRYQSLEEHVSSPNSEPSLKDGYQCLNEYCIANNLRATWTDDGEIFMDPPTGVKSTVAHEIIKKTGVNGNYYALDSWSERYERMKMDKEKRKRTYHIGKWKINTSPTYNFPDVDKEWKRNFFKRETEILKKSEEDGCWRLVIPTHRMVLHCMKSFNRRKKQALEGNKTSLRECTNDILSYTSWGTKDDRFYSKIVAFLLKALYPRTCNRILRLNAVANPDKNMLRFLLLIAPGFAMLMTVFVLQEIAIKQIRKNHFMFSRKLMNIATKLSHVAFYVVFIGLLIWSVLEALEP
jgi:CRISPR/Cas system CSM-associated protein Csm2 small subunit